MICDFCSQEPVTQSYPANYVSHYNDGDVKKFLGGSDCSRPRQQTRCGTIFFDSIAQSIVERYKDTNMQNLKEGLESCLLMTESKCNVPDPLQKEFGATEMTLGQFLLKKN